VRRGVPARLAAIAAAVLLAACASVPTSTEQPAGETVSGRLALRVDAAAGVEARSVSAAFDLQGRPEAGRLELSTPLGSLMARARWAPGEVVLITPQGETPYASLDALTRDVLGESLPVAALFDWLQGRPWRGASHVPLVAPAGPGFRQLGWNVNLAQFAESTLIAVREQPPVIQVRVKIER
jgi:outer membrane lipoprotein LolB